MAICYQQQFPDSLIAKNVSIGSEQMSYIVAYGLGPNFSHLIITNIMKGQSFFTLHFDETVTAQGKEQMDLPVCYWSETHHEMKVKYLTSAMFGHS